MRSEKLGYKTVYILFLTLQIKTLVENIPKYLQLVMFEQLKYGFPPISKCKKNIL